MEDRMQASPRMVRRHGDLRDIEDIGTPRK